MSARKLTFIPGPIEFSDAVLSAMATPSQAHTSPEFVAVFQEALTKTRKVFNTSLESGSQPFVLAGSGTLGWDLAGANLINRGESALVLSTGFFSESLSNCLKVYTDDVDILQAQEFGSSVDLSKVKSALESKKYSLISITQTDTSSGVLSNVEEIAAIVKKVSPETLIIVDGVCATACETLLFDAWGIDFVLTASQKAIGVPAGLSISLASKRAIEKAFNKEHPTSFFCDMKRWTPVMKAYESGNGAYFATPAVQLVHAYNVSLNELLESGDISDRITAHKIASDSFKDKVESLGLKLVPKSRELAAHGLSVIYYPEGINGGDLLKAMAANGFTIASGIYKEYKDKYFRIGHMGVAAVGARKAELDQCFNALKLSLEQLGYNDAKL
ncbi:alanine--glyoxylate transaminase [Martiniozyma asiatica (nom. inval.)]|nr:alanine--glyoxylate transaminase [Martiniozyma asiatica]